MYRPTAPTQYASLPDRIAADVRYGDPTLMRLMSARVDEQGLTHWYLIGLDGRQSWVDADWAVLTDASDQEAQPDLITLLGMATPPRSRA
jgi:hypothetical protein